MIGCDLKWAGLRHETPGLKIIPTPALVWSIESYYKQLFPSSVWNSYLSSLEGRPSLNSTGISIDQSLFMETQLGPGESALSCLLLKNNNQNIP